MKRNIRTLVGMAAGALAAVLVAAAWLLIADPPRQRQRLPDGSVVTLESVGYGRRHEFVTGTGWRRRVAAFFPQVFPPRGGRTSSPRQDTLVFNLHRRGNPQDGWHSRWRTAAFDDHGCEFLVFSHWEPAEPGGKGGDLLSQASATAFPRRGPQVRLGILERSGTAPVAAFTTRNPAPGAFPDWTPEPYPITKRSGSLAFTLEELVTRPSWSPRTPAARFRVTENGRPVPGWVPSQVTALDATGNDVGLTELVPVDGAVPFGGLCTHEAAWKLRVDFACDTPVATAPDLTLTARGISVPGRGQLSRSGASAARGGMRLDFLGIGGPGEVSWQPGRYSVRGDRRAYARVRSTSPGYGARVTVLRMTDEQGNDLLPPYSGPRGANRTGRPTEVVGGPSDECDFPLPGAAGGKRLDFTFLVHRTHTVEFLASPAALRSAK